MRRTSPTKFTSTGFTLIEVVVIAPILILTLGGFVYTLSNIIADTLVIRDSNTMIYDTQASLDRIEQDIRLSTQFPTTTGTMPSPQGSDGTPAFTGTAAFNSATTLTANSGANALILTTISTTANPLSPSRQGVYFANQPNPCDLTQIYNTRLLTTVIYYVNNGSLYRRTYVPPWTTTAGQSTTVCNAPWQQDSCSPGYTSTQAAPTGPCQTNDAKLMDNVSSVTVNFYGSAGSTTDLGPTNALNATTLGVTIAASKTTAGQPVTNTGLIRATKLNTSS